MQNTDLFSKAAFNRESLEAYVRQLGVEGRTARVFGLLYEHDPAGLTQDGAAALLGMLTQTASGRFTELLEHGLIMRKPIPGTDDYETALTRSNSTAAVCVVSPDWRRAAQNYRARKRMQKEEKRAAERAVARALAENAELREVLRDLLTIIEVNLPEPDAELTEALDLIRKEYLSGPCNGPSSPP